MDRTANTNIQVSHIISIDELLEWKGIIKKYGVGRNGLVRTDLETIKTGLKRQKTGLERTCWLGKMGEQGGN